MTTSVLISDGTFKHTLAAVRSLGRKGIDTVVTASTPLAQSFYSRYCSSRVLVPSSSENPNSFMRATMRILGRQKCDVYLPIGWHANYYASKHKKLLEQYTSIPVASFESMNIAANKDKTMRFAMEQGINVPRTYYPRRENDLTNICRELEFPIVIKASTSAGMVYYAKSEEELRMYYRTIAAHSPIVQEYVDGEGCGFFGLYNDGKCVANFMHKRIREFPISGGPSVAAEAYYSSNLKAEGMKLLDALDWNGVAMVEFKRDTKDKKYKLMEINPKFWGSLDLAISAGVDFPFLAYQMAEGNSFATNPKYNIRTKFRWPFPGDLMHALSTRSLKKFIADFGSAEFKDDVDISDLGPTPIQFIMTLNELSKGLHRR